MGTSAAKRAIKSSGSKMAQSANWPKRTDRLLCREAETSAKNPDTFIFG
jgi:hypothetical protein